MSYRAWTLALLAVLVLAAPAAADNLIQNPGAEDQTMAHWTGTATALTYGLGVFPSRAVGDQYTGGCDFFSAPPRSAANASSTQVIDLSPFPEIAEGNVVGKLSGYLGG